ncbi:MAG: ABC transporter permease [Actinomycetota bacterium]
MFRATWKGLIGHRLRFALSALAIALGVGLVAASFMFTDSLGKAFDDLFGATLAGFDIQVRPIVDDDLAFTQGKPLPDSRVEEVAAVAGVDAAAGSLFGFAQVAIDGEAVHSGQAPSFIVSWPKLIATFGVRSGEEPDSPGEAALDPATAARYEVADGEQIQVIGVGEPQTYTVTGTAGLEGFDTFGGAVSVYVPLADAQSVLGLPDQVLTIEVQSDDQVSTDEMIARIEPMLPERAEAVSAQSAAEEQLATFKDALGFLNTFLLVFGGVTVFVAAFLIQNTFRIIVAQRTQELAMLRAVGASRRQVIGMVLSEAAVVGLLASLAGLSLGVLLAQLIRRLLSFGGALPSAPLQLAPRTVLVGLTTGLLITLISAVLPARSASRVAPVAALRQVQAPDAAGSLRRRSVLGLAATAAGLLILAAGLIEEMPELVVSSITLVGIGAGLIFVGVAILAAVVARPVTSLVGAPLRRIGVPGRLAVENAGRSPRRTAATASALMVGLALVGLTLVLADSLKTTAARLLEERFKADLVVAPAGFGGSRLSPELTARIAALGEVALATSVRGGQVEVEDDTRFLIGGDPGALMRVVDFTVEKGSLADVGPGTIGVRSGAAEELGWAVGDTVTVRFARTGDQQFEVAAIYDARGLGAGLMVDLATFSANFTEQFDDQIFLKLADGVGLEAGKRAVVAVADTFVGAEVLDQSEFRQQASSQINQLVRLVFGLLGVAVVIAIFGITNTLSLSVLERTREIGLLRALGMSRRQLRRSITWESILIALLGAVMGMALGLFFAWDVITALRDEFLRLSIPWGQVALAIGAAGFAGVVAAVIPAWRASQKDILTAIAYE